MQAKIMTVDRNEKTGDLRARETGLGSDLNLTEIARRIIQRALPKEEVEDEILSHIGSEVVTDGVEVILQKTRQELKKLTKRKSVFWKSCG
jgi:hypothetical protein